jgi:hypothetical protein
VAFTGIGDTLQLTASATSVIQPPSGEVWNVTVLGGDDSSGTSTYLDLWDGTDGAVVAFSHISSSGLAGSPKTHMALILTNTQYARLRNIGTAGPAGYRGVKL